MNSIAFHLVEVSIRCGVIEEKDRDLYNLAVLSLFFSMLTWGSLIVIGAVLGEVRGCLIFLIFHIPLRIYAGGYHQNSRIKCYMQSIVIFGFLMFGALSPVKSWMIQNWMVLMAVSSMVIWYFAPVESLKKPLNLKERKHHKAIARTIFTLELIVLILFNLNQSDANLYYSAMSVLLVAIQLVLGVLEHHLQGHGCVHT